MSCSQRSYAIDVFSIRLRAEMGRVIEVVRTFIPAERWPQVQAALRGEAPTRRQQPQVVERVRMVEIDDSDEDGN